MNRTTFRPGAAALTAALLAVVALGCGTSDGSSPASEAAMTEPDFRLSSTAFADGDPIPARFTCDGDDASPDLTWEGAPAGTAAFVLLVDDPDARGFAHWIVFDLTGSASGGLAEGISTSPDAPPQGTNDFRRIGWGGPCPPSGEHRYVFRLLALDQALELAGAPRADVVLAAADGHVIGEARLTARYRRGG